METIIQDFFMLKQKSEEARISLIGLKTTMGTFLRITGMLWKVSHFFKKLWKSKNEVDLNDLPFLEEYINDENRDWVKIPDEDEIKKWFGLCRMIKAHDLVALDRKLLKRSQSVILRNFSSFENFLKIGIRLMWSLFLKLPLLPSFLIIDPSDIVTFVIKLSPRFWQRD